MPAEAGCRVEEPLIVPNEQEEIQEAPRKQILNIGLKVK